MHCTEHRLGFWAALLSAVSSVGWFVTYSLRDQLGPAPSWHDPEGYAASFSWLRMAYIYPSLLLALSFLVLLAVIHRLAPEEKKIWSLVALIIGGVYATMASINYTIQAVAVRLSLQHGQTEGIELFLPDNPHSVFNALASSYVYMALAMCAAGLVFNGDRLQRALRFALCAQLVAAVGQTAWSLYGVPEEVFLASSLVWVLGAPAAFGLLAVQLRRGRPIGRGLRETADPRTATSREHHLSALPWASHDHPHA